MFKNAFCYLRVRPFFLNDGIVLDNSVRNTMLKVIFPVLGSLRLSSPEHNDTLNRLYMVNVVKVTV